MVGRSSFCQKKRVIGVDLAGADVDQLLLFAACQEAAAESSISLRCYLSIPHQIQASSIECLYCPDVISMSDEALPAIRKKKDSSLVRAMMDVKSGETSAVVTCANTGAVTAASVIHLKRFSGLHHPALIAELPLPGGRVIALDMGAFVGASGRDLVSYSYLGRAYALLRHGIQRPRVGLLNIGREQGRGTPELRLADHLLSSSLSENWEYVGNVEPSDVFSGKADVLVTSGFAGNIFLKTAEAAVQRTHSSFLSYQPQGALLGGVRGVVVKCHGSASKEALITAISQAQNAVASNLVQKLEEQFSRSLGLAAKE